MLALHHSLGGTHYTLPLEQNPALCQRHHIRKLVLFGSVLRGDFNADSDIDGLV